MADFLGGMRIASTRRVRASLRSTPEAEIRRRADDAPPPPPLVLSPEGFDVIAEVKRRAPSSRVVDAKPGLPERLARSYAAGGAAAVSVLTEPLAFGGSLRDLELAARVLRGAPRPIPTMRKDFLVDPYQVFEARVAGAGGVLLIADLLGPGEAQALVEAACEAGLWLLVETFSEVGRVRAERISADAVGSGVDAMLGVNVRDLRTLEVDGTRLARLAPALPRLVTCVAESGMRTPADVARAARLGYGAALVGRALATAREPRELLANMIRAGRAGRAERLEPA